MKLDKETESKIEKLPTILKVAVKMLLECLDNIINGKCNEEDVVNTIGTLNQNAMGRYAPEDLMNYDEAGKCLGMGVCNRNKLKSTLDKAKIKQVCFKNLKIGFPSIKIRSLKDKLSK